ncbi:MULTISPECIES: hypothetical protein [unclassified Cellvibrio]|uniref:hypothetical protein n=1 Tax=unclassified Cellvibrio TaxID=2624793 RepID=UPI000785A028|nr:MULTISPECIES: hypothetical protein [unclassified Cellvibrio]QEY16999.1 endo-1,3-beta-xylanase [Cellvibrio sp. KY-GH-1]
MYKSNAKYKALPLLLLIGLTGCKKDSADNQSATAPVEDKTQSVASSSPSLAAKLLPDNDKVLFIMGQDTETLNAFKTDVLDKDANFPYPGGVTLYTKIAHSFKFGSLAGVTSDVDYGSGRNNFVETLNQFPGAALAVGLDITDAHDDCKSIPTKAVAGLVDGEVTPELVSYYRSEVDKLLTFLKESDRQIFLRIGYEFDGPWNCYNPEAYKETFRFIKQRIDVLDAKNIATVWQTASWLRDQGIYKVSDPNHLETYYPGDDVVDWVSFSKFYGEHYRKYQWNCDALNPEWFTPQVSAVSQHDRVLNFARAHHKPVMISEAAPAAFSTSTLTASCIFTNHPVAITVDDLWETWYQDYFDYIEENRDVIRAAAYINTNWHTQSMWYCEPEATAGAEGCKQSYWGDSRIEGNPIILERFSKEISKSHFVQKSRP